MTYLLLAGCTCRAASEGSSNSACAVFATLITLADGLPSFCQFVASPIFFSLSHQTPPINEPVMLGLFSVQMIASVIGVCASCGVCFGDKHQSNHLGSPVAITLFISALLGTLFSVSLFIDQVVMYIVISALVCCCVTACCCNNSSSSSSSSTKRYLLIEID